MITFFRHKVNTVQASSRLGNVCRNTELFLEEKTLINNYLAKERAFYRLNERFVSNKTRDIIFSTRIFRMLNSDKHFANDLPTRAETQIFTCKNIKFTCLNRKFKRLFQFSSHFWFKIKQMLINDTLLAKLQSDRKLEI